MVFPKVMSLFQTSCQKEFLIEFIFFIKKSIPCFPKSYNMNDHIFLTKEQHFLIHVSLSALMKFSMYTILIHLYS